MAITHRWRTHIEAWQKTSLSQAAYCRQHHLNSRTFTARLSEYRKGNAESEPVLIPVTMTEELIVSNSGCQNIMVYCAQGHRLELPETVSAQWLSSLLRGLG
ncbi:MAG: IS66 family insertion sequence element accessory protein TnpB [Gammaproteobacteria bacterium]|nr:IS66 family insertion sequence element accessory protein TnpB [Gammaproteobacteria bacterium]